MSCEIHGTDKVNADYCSICEQYNPKTYEHYQWVYENAKWLIEDNSRIKPEIVKLKSDIRRAYRIYDILINSNFTDKKKINEIMPLFISWAKAIEKRNKARNRYISVHSK